MVKIVRSLVGFIAVFVGISLALGVLTVQVHPIVGMMATAAVAGLAYGVAKGDEFSVTFGLSLGAVLIILYQLVPLSIATRLPYGKLLMGYDALTIGLWASLIILGWWTIDIRFLSGRAKKPETVAKRLRKRTVGLIETYATITRVIIVGGVLAGVAVLGQIGAGFGELGSAIADAPWVAADFITAGLGFVAGGGDLPLLGGVSITAGAFLALALVVVIAAAAADNA